MRDYALRIFLLKVKARCNINCSYCYEYNSADTSWRKKPGSMSLDVVKKIAQRINKYVLEKKLTQISIAFHGGEPLLLSPEWFVEAMNIFQNKLPVNLQINYSLQTNGILINEHFLEVFKSLNIKIGISLDGTKEANDRFRVGFKGESTFEDTIKGIQLINRIVYDSINAGILTVIDPRNEPLKTFNFLASTGTKSIDFLYPHYNHSCKPPFEEGVISKWLISIFDEWWNNNFDIKIRVFEDALHLMLGGAYSVENMGLAPVELLVIQTDGSYEAVDSLKSTFDGAVFTGKNVFSDELESVLSYDMIEQRLNRANNLCNICKKCRFVRVCGGGYLPHRFNYLNGFDNPSIYCEDLKMIFSHIESRLIIDFPELKAVLEENLIPIKNYD